MAPLLASSWNLVPSGAMRLHKHHKVILMCIYIYICTHMNIHVKHTHNTYLCICMLASRLAQTCRQARRQYVFTAPASWEPDLPWLMRAFAAESYCFLLVLLVIENLHHLILVLYIHIHIYVCTILPEFLWFWYTGPI